MMVCAQTVCYLKALGYNVTYVQFSGQHVVPPAIAADTVQWYLGRSAGAGGIPAGICNG